MNQEELQKGKIRIISIVQNASLGAFISGYTGAELSYTFEAVKNNLDLNDDPNFYNIFFTVSIIVGSVLGAILYSQLHQYSTKRIIMIVADLIFIASVTFRFDSWEAFALQRLLKGIVNGLNLCAGLLYIREISPDYLSDKSICIFQININMGILLANLVSIPLADSDQRSTSQTNNPGDSTSSYWKFVFCFPLIIALIRVYVLIFIFDFDTPFSYYQQNQTVKGKKLLKKLHFTKQDEIIYDTYRYYEEDKQTTYKQRWISASIVFAIQQLCGINSIIQQSNTSIVSFTSTSQSQAILQLFMNLILLSMAILTYFMIDKYNYRILRTMMTGGCIILGICLIQMVCFQIFVDNQTFQMLNISLYFFVFNSTLGPVTLIYISDISKDHVMSMGFYSYWITYMISSGLQLTNLPYIPIFFALSCFAGAFYYNKYWYPTKHRKFYDINQNLSTEQIYHNQLIDDPNRSSEKKSE